MLQRLKTFIHTFADKSLIDIYETRISLMKQELRGWEETCARLSDQVAAFRHAKMVLVERDAPVRHCESCGTRALAHIKMNGRYKQYALCKHCWVELKLLIQSGMFMETHPEFLVEDKEKKDDKH